MALRYQHYRDRGIDGAALDVIEERHGTSGIVFVDGWTEVKARITGNCTRAGGILGYPEQPRLVVLADPVAAPGFAASDDDWLIPFGIMGAPVSGLISRSVWSLLKDYMGAWFASISVNSNAAGCLSIPSTHFRKS